MTWKHLLPLLAKKAQSMPSVGKIIANVFSDHKGVLIEDSLNYGNTETSECYCDTLETL